MNSGVRDTYTYCVSTFWMFGGDSFSSFLLSFFFLLSKFLSIPNFLFFCFQSLMDTSGGEWTGKGMGGGKGNLTRSSTVTTSYDLNVLSTDKSREQERIFISLAEVLDRELVRTEQASMSSLAWRQWVSTSRNGCPPERTMCTLHIHRDITKHGRQCLSADPLFNDFN